MQLGQADDLLLERQSAHAALDALHEDCLAAQQIRIATVEGEPGIGKSAFLSAALASLKDKAPESVIGIGRCTDHLSVSSSYQAMRDAWTNLLADLRAKGKFHLAGNRLGKSLAHAAPDWLAAVPNAGELLSATYKTLKAATDYGSQIAPSVPKQFANALREIQGVGPLILALDDMHWADASTLELLYALSLELNDIPLLLILAFRSHEAAEHHGRASQLRQTLLTIERHHPIVRLPLPPLSNSGIRSYWVNSTEVKCGPELLEALSELSGGNPLFLREWVELLKQIEQPASHISARHKHLLRVPRKIEAVIQSRMELLSRSERRIIEVASVLGPVFRTQWLDGMLKTEDINKPQKALRRLMSETKILRYATINGNQPGLAFDHYLTMRVMASQIRDQSPLDFSSLSLRAAQIAVLANQLTLDDELAVSHFYEQADHRCDALKHALAAARMADSMGAYPEVVQILGPYIASIAEDLDQEVYAEAIRLAFEASIAMSDYSDVHRAWNALPPNLRNNPRLALSAARAFRMLSKWTEAFGLLEGISAAATKLPEGVLVESEMLRGEILLCGRPQQAQEAIEVFRKLLTEHDLSAPEASRCQGHIGLAQLAMRRRASAVRSLDEAIATAEHSSSPYDKYEAVHWRCKAAIASLDLAGALHLLQDQARLSSKSGAAAVIPFHLRDRSRVLALDGQLENAAADFDVYFTAIVTTRDILQIQRAVVNAGLLAYELRLTSGLAIARELKRLICDRAEAGAYCLGPYRETVWASMQSALEVRSVSGLAKRLATLLACAEHVFWDAEAIFRFDVPDFWEARSVSGPV